SVFVRDAHVKGVGRWDQGCRSMLPDIRFCTGTEFQHSCRSLPGAHAKSVPAGCRRPRFATGGADVSANGSVSPPVVFSDAAVAPRPLPHYLLSQEAPAHETIAPRPRRGP